MTEKISIGFIGCGAMGGALAKAIRQSDSKINIIVSAKNFENAKKFAKENKCEAAKNNIEIAKKANYIFIAVKPTQVASVLTEISDYLKKDTVIISMAAGLPLAALMALCPTDIAIARIMPNTPAIVKEAMIAICFNDKVIETEKNFIYEILQAAGQVNIVAENMIDCVTAVSGSGPAYVFMFIEAMADAAVKCGMKRTDAYIYAAQTVKGAATLMLETGKTPAALKDMVCSPAGTTIEAVSALERGGLRAAVINAVDAAFEKSKNMKNS